MGVAWLLATALAKFPNATRVFVRSSNLPADGIKAFGIIFYGNAQKVVADAIVGEVEHITATLQPINIDDRIKPEAKARGFIRLTDDKQTLTDLLIISEKPSPKLIYFHGTFKPENIDYKK